MVNARFEELLPASRLVTAGDTAWLTEKDDGHLWLSLRRADGTLIGERLLDRALGCQDLARAAAVALAAWLSDVHPDFAASVADVSPPPSPPAPPAHDSGQWDLSIGGAVALPAGTLIPALSAEAGWSRVPGGLGLRGIAMLSGTRNETLGTAGRALWARHVLIAALSWRWSLRPIDVEALAGPAGGLFTVRGEGFGRNHSRQTLLAGAGAGLSVSRTFGSWTPWVGVKGLIWPRMQHLRASSETEQRTLSPVDVYAGAGLRLGL
jgi:hypothetical protein